MTAPNQRKRLLIEVGSAEPPTQRERDAAALHTFARLLELGASPTQWAQFVAEPWHVILQRYLADLYPRADKSKQTELIARHFWLRQCVYREKQGVSALEVAAALKRVGTEMSSETVLTIAKRSENRHPARQWIAARFRHYRREYTRDSMARALLEQFEPGEGAEIVQRAFSSLHRESPQKE